MASEHAPDISFIQAIEGEVKIIQIAMHRVLWPQAISSITNRVQKDTQIRNIPLRKHG